MLFITSEKVLKYAEDEARVVDKRWKEFTCYRTEAMKARVEDWVKGVQNIPACPDKPYRTSCGVIRQRRARRMVIPLQQCVDQRFEEDHKID